MGGVLLFDEIKTYNDIRVVNDFTRYKHLLHDLNPVNKVSKSIKVIPNDQVSWRVFYRCFYERRSLCFSSK